jgi:hypothetical protein
MTRVIRYTQKQFELPSEGIHLARLIEIKDLEPGLNPKGEEKSRVRFVWELADEVNISGNPMKAFQTFNVSLHPKSFLGQAIHDITGRDPGNQFDLDSLLGVEVQLVLKHNQGDDGRVYCNVAAILRAKTEAEDAEDAQATAKVKAAAVSDRAEITDEDIPF